MDPGGPNWILWCGNHNRGLISLNVTTKGRPSCLSDPTLCVSRPLRMAASLTVSNSTKRQLAIHIEDKSLVSPVKAWGYIDPESTKEWGQLKEGKFTLRVMDPSKSSYIEPSQTYRYHGSRVKNVGGLVVTVVVGWFCWKFALYGFDSVGLAIELMEGITIIIGLTIGVVFGMSIGLRFQLVVGLLFALMMGLLLGTIEQSVRNPEWGVQVMKVLNGKGYLCVQLFLSLGLLQGVGVGFGMVFGYHVLQYAQFAMSLLCASYVMGVGLSGQTKSQSDYGLAIIGLFIGVFCSWLGHIILRDSNPNWKTQEIVEKHVHLTKDTQRYIFEQNGYLKWRRYILEIAGKTSFMITGNEAQELHWKSFGFKLHVPRNALKKGVSDCTIQVKAFLPNNYLELPENTQLVSAVYHISMTSPSALAKQVDMEIEHCCILTEGHQDMLWFVTSKAADWETATFSFIDGGHFDDRNTHGRISLHSFSWYAAVWKGIMSLFSVRYCIKVYQKSVALTTKYIYLILIKNLEVHIQAIETQHERQNELCGCEVTFDDDSDQVLLDIDKDGETTKDGWHIRPCMYPPLIKMESAGYFRPGQQPPECKLLAQASNQESIRQLFYVLNLKGLLTPSFVLLHLPIQAPMNKQELDESHSVVKETPRKIDIPTLGHLHRFTGQSGRVIKVIEQVSHKWENVAYAMEFDAAVVKAIQRDVSFQTTPACEEVFYRWLITAGDTQTPKTWEFLIAKLRHSGFSVLADDVLSELL